VKGEMIEVNMKGYISKCVGQYCSHENSLIDLGVRRVNPLSSCLFCSQIFWHQTECCIWNTYLHRKNFRSRWSCL